MRVGEEIEAYCASCKGVHWHIIIAMVDARPAKVECLSCHKQHTLRTGRSRRKRAPLERSRTSSAAVPGSSDLAARLKEGEANARPYQPDDAFAKDEIIRHPRFGLGLVLGVPAPQRIEVAFVATGTKVLLQNRGNAGPRLARPTEPATPMDIVGDAPPPGSTEHS